MLAAGFCAYDVVPDIVERRRTSSVRRGPAGSGLIALTFDDGPHPEITPRVLAALEAVGGRGTFFMVGRNVRRHPTLVRRVIAAGHAVGVHTESHRHAWITSPGRLRAELDQCLEAIVTAGGGRRPLWFRPPWGAFNAATHRTARARGLRTALWSCDAGDWLPGASHQAILRRVRAGLGSGVIVDLHDGGQTPSGCRAMAEALPDILAAAAARGLRAAHIGELFGLPALG